MRIMPGTYAGIDFKFQLVINVELHAEFARIITYDSQQKRCKSYDLPKDSYLKVSSDPAEHSDRVEFNSVAKTKRINRELIPTKESSWATLLSPVVTLS